MRDHGPMTDRHQHLFTCVRALGAHMVGPIIETPSSVLVSVSLSDEPPFSGPPFVFSVVGSRPWGLMRESVWMLKLAFGAEERAGLEVQRAWGRDVVEVGVLGYLETGAETKAELDAHAESGTFALLELGDPKPANTFDLAAVRGLCAAASRLHTSVPLPSGLVISALDTAQNDGSRSRTAPTDTTAPGSGTGESDSDESSTHMELVPLVRRFESLLESEPAALTPDREIAALLSRARLDVRALLADPLDCVPLHGDVHHGNLLRVVRAGEIIDLLTDPKGLVGESLYDFVNIVFNPDVLDPRVAELFHERVECVVSHLEAAHGSSVGVASLRERFLRWVRAYGCLSAVWHLEDSQLKEGVPEHFCATLRVAGLADELLSPSL